MNGALPQATLQRILLRQPTRGRVYGAIAERPGLHARALSRQLDLALGTVEHHIRQLERHNLVFAYQAGRRRTLYASDTVDASEVALLHAMAKPIWAQVLRGLHDHPEVGVATLARRLGMPPSSLSHHLGRLKQIGLVEGHKVGRESIYLLCEPHKVGTHLPRPFAGVVLRAAAMTRRGSTEVRPRTDHIAATY